MKAVLDAEGRIQLPEEVRQAAGLVPGAELEVTLRDGRIELEPASVPLLLVQQGRWLLPISVTDIPMMTTDKVEELRQQILDERVREMFP